jgi:hypothetical protein
VIVLETPVADKANQIHLRPSPDIDHNNPFIDRPALGLRLATFGEHAAVMPIAEDDCVVCKS